MAIRNSIHTFASVQQVSWKGYDQRTDAVGIEHLYALVEDAVRSVRAQGYRVTDDMLHSAYCRMAEIHSGSTVIHIDAIRLAVRAYVLRNIF
jgi:hypothetical protein